MRARAAFGVLALLAAATAAIGAQGGGNKTLTAVPGIKVGHYTLAERPTGCTVVLAEAGVTAGVDVRGSAPATRETDLLNPVNLVQIAHAIALSGGSAFGLDTASGVMRYLEERRIGFEFGPAHVPIVPAAAIFDLSVGDGRIRPTADCGYQAARAATDAPVAEGSIGAGAGATVGKTAGMGRAMKGGDRQRRHRAAQRPHRRRARRRQRGGRRHRSRQRSGRGRRAHGGRQGVRRCAEAAAGRRGGNRGRPGRTRRSASSPPTRA